MYAVRMKTSLQHVSQRVMSPAQVRSSLSMRCITTKSPVTPPSTAPVSPNSTPANPPQRAFTSTPTKRMPKNQSRSPLHPIGVEAAIRAAEDPSFVPRATLLSKEFSLEGRVAVVTGAHQGLGLEMAESLAEAGAKVYCLDLFKEPDATFRATQTYVSRLGIEGASLEYQTVDVTNQKAVWDVFAQIAEKEGRMDVCVAAAGILRENDCLNYPAEDFDKLMKVNVNGVFHTAQAAGREMEKLGTKGSIILIASMSGSIHNRVCTLFPRYRIFSPIYLLTVTFDFEKIGSKVGCVHDE